MEKLGKKGELKQVADGYARNFLIPKKMAVLATKSEIAKLEKQKAIETERAEEELVQFQEMASQLDGLELEIPVKADENGKLFGTVNANLISEKLKSQGLGIEKDWIKLKEPIKELGDFEVNIELPHNLETAIKIIVVKEK